MSKAREININNERIREAIRKKKDFQVIDNDLRRRINIDCGTTAFAVYMELISRLNVKTGLCCPSQDEIARSIGIAKRTVVNSLEKLKEKRYIDYVKVKSKTNAFSNNEYYFMYPKQELASEEVVEKKECKVIPMPVARKAVTAPDISKAPSMPALRKLPIVFNPGKVPPAPSKAIQEVQVKPEAKEKPVAVNKEKNKMPAEIKTLLNEYKSLINKLNKMLSADKQWKDTRINDIKDMIDRGDTESALNEARWSIKEVKDVIEDKEKEIRKEVLDKEFNKRIDSITLEEALKVFSILKHELTKRYVEMVERNLKHSNNPQQLAKGLVVGIKNAVEAKGLEFDLNKILAL